MVADRDVPHYRRAAMDGYAVRARDTRGATAGSPVVLEKATTDVREGTAVYVDTGCELPPGADAVARIETVQEHGETIRALEAVCRGKDVAPNVEDVTAGQHQYRPGRRLRPTDLGVLRSLGIEETTVYERPTVAIVPTGEELVESDPDPWEVIETNGSMLSRFVTRWGGIPRPRAVTTDSRAPFRRAVEESLSADLVVTIGGSSVGKRDLLPGVVAELGGMYVHHFAIKPGHPVTLGEVDDTPVVMLPGYPVSCVLTAVQFVRSAVHWTQAVEPSPFSTVEAELREPIGSERGTRRFERVSLEDHDGGLVATPSDQRGTEAFTSVTSSDGWVVVDERRDAIDAGTTVSVELWKHRL